MYDGDGDKTVNKKEFADFIKKREKALWRAFQALDLDKNGAITPDEALKAAGRLTRYKRRTSHTPVDPSRALDEYPGGRRYPSVDEISCAARDPRRGCESSA